ncbi:hypothetical protein HDU99_009349, partial [Rhizoclosmatium hyalinum]
AIGSRTVLCALTPSIIAPNLSMLVFTHNKMTMEVAILVPTMLKSKTKYGKNFNTREHIKTIDIVEFEETLIKAAGRDEYDSPT